MKIKDKRRIKLQYKQRLLAEGKEKIVPELRINGIWLEENGFKAGGQVEITVNPNELIIKPIN